MKRKVAFWAIALLSLIFVLVWFFWSAILRQGVFYALRNRDQKLLEAVLSLGISPNVTNKTADPAIIVATICDEPKMVQLLLTYGAEISKHDDSNSTAVQICVGFGGGDETLDVLLRGGADPNSPQHDLNNKTPLMSAAEAGDLNKIKLLLKYKADPNRMDGTGKTAIDYANGNQTIIDVLKANK